MHVIKGLHCSARGQKEVAKLNDRLGELCGFPTDKYTTTYRCVLVYVVCYKVVFNKNKLPVCKTVQSFYELV